MPNPNLNKQVKVTLPKVKLLKSVKHFSVTQLTLFVLVFAAIGGYLLYRSLAATPLVASLEAEQMMLPAGGSLVTDTSASAGKAALLSANGTATGNVNFPSQVSSLSVLAKGAQCNGAPSMNVSLDGTNLLTGTAVASTSWTSYSVTPANPIAVGTHSLSITFSNDYTSPGHGKKGNGACSRDLYVDVTNFYGPAVVTSPPTVTISASPASVSAGGSSTLTWNSTNADSCLASGAWSGSQPTSGSTSTGAINQNSVYSLTCTNNSSGQSASASATITISGALAILPSNLPPATVGQSYSAAISVTGPNGPYTVRIGQGTFPPGLTLKSDGTITGTPTTAGSYQFTVGAYDAQNTYVGFRDYYDYNNGTFVVKSSTTSTLIPSGAYQWYDGESWPPPDPWIAYNASGIFSTAGVHLSQVDDPFNAGEGKVALLQDDYDSSIPTTYTHDSLQQSAVFVNPPYAHAGYQTTNESTWYVARFGVPTDNVWPGGEGPTIVGWHFSVGGPGPQSSVLQAYDPQYRLTSSGNTDGEYILMRISIMNPDGSTSFRFFPGGGTTFDSAVAAGAPLYQKGHWYTGVWHWVWSTSSSTGRLEFWLDGTKIADFTGQTQSAGDYYSFGGYNYRYNITRSTKIYFANLGIGPTKASIGIP